MAISFLLVWRSVTGLVCYFCKLNVKVVIFTVVILRIPLNFSSQCLICYNDPAEHPFITEKEREYLRRELGEPKRRTDLPPTPWREILTCPAIIALIFAQIGHNWGLFIIINDLPKYMKYVVYIGYMNCIC